MKTGSTLISQINEPLAQNALAFWWMGQLGYAVRMGGLKLYFDLYLSPNPQRNHVPICLPEEIEGADLFFGTHDHIDHIDRAIWPLLATASPCAKFVVPRALADTLSAELGIERARFIAINDGETVCADGVEITGVAAAHELLRRDPVTREYSCMGYIVRAHGRVLYHSGDTCVYGSFPYRDAPGLLQKLLDAPRFDVAFLPINGRDAKRLRTGCIGNMTYQEAVDLFGALRPGLCVPGHYEMFPSNAENPLLFADYLDAKYPDLPCWIGMHGTRVDVAPLPR